MQFTKMSKCVILTTMVLCLPALSLSAPAVGSNAKSEQPNILFFLVDDQRNDTLGCAGHPIVRTPVIDSLAAGGVRFGNAFVTTSICAASRASIFTGLYERTHGYTFGKPPLRPDHISKSYPVVMRKAGYRTGFIGKYGVRTEGKLESEMFDFFKPHGHGWHKQPDGSMRHETEIAGDRAIEFLQGNPASKPFCLSVSFNASHAVDGDKRPGIGHYPWPKAVDGMYEDITIPAPRLSDPAIFESQPEFLRKSMNRDRYFWRWDTPEKYQKNMRAYYRMLSGIDRVIGRIRKTLEELNLDHNTVIIYMADNGYYMGDRGFAGKWSHYEQSLRVPLIIYDPRLPKEKRGQVRRRMALNIDIPATMLALAQAEIPTQYQGSSLVPLLRGEDDPDWRKDFFCEHLMDNKSIPKWEGIRAERYVYARYFEQEPVFEFLHDLRTDPDQLVNLATDPEYRNILARMSKRCDVLKGRYIDARHADAVVSPLDQGNTEITAAASANCESKSIRVSRLRCEYQDRPLGIDHPAPRLNWIVESSVRGQKQTAYRVLVARNMKALRAGRGDLWDSGVVESEQSVHIVYAGSTLNSGQRCFWKVKVWDKDGVSSDWSNASYWEMGLLKTGDWKAQWINDAKPLPETDADFYRDDPAPLFRREFKVSRPVRRARLYISALGYVHPRLNGSAVGDCHLEPLWTLPNKRVFYSVYDVSAGLRRGDNCLGVMLGNGWYNPLPLRMWGRVNLRERLPVGRPQFIAQLAIEYTDGSRELVTSDSKWKVAPGPILRNNIYLGEKVDARKAVEGWDKPGLDDCTWGSAGIAPTPEGFLQAQPAPPIKVTARVKPVRITEPSDGVYIVDMGQNFGGWARFTFDVAEGTQITMRYGELLYEDGTLNPMTSVCGQIKRNKPPADGSPAIAWQEDTYIARGGGPETYAPRFTFHAFRYIEIAGLPARPSLDDIEGLRMNCAVEPVGSFSCSNDTFNRIQKMCQWTFLSNLFGVQSDCPHRERFGYGGDLVTTSDAFMLNYDMANFYAKAVRDWHDSALPDGMLTDTAPSVGIQYCGVGWAMAHPHLQVQLYRYYGDRRIIEEQYPTSKRWLDLVRSQNPDHIVRRGLHDHEALEKEKSPPMITPLYCESARMLSHLARILDKEHEAEHYGRLAGDIRRAYVENFLVPGTGVAASGIQSVQAFALFLNMLPEKERPAALTHLIGDITDKHNGHLTTGIFGTRYMLDVLSREGHAEVVSNMVNLRGFPGWRHMLEQDATTLWEHWKFSDNTFSHNHPMFGSVSQWFYNWLGGIEPVVDAVGFDRFTFQPQFIEGLDWVRCTYRSIRGPITCDWKRRDHGIALNLSVPVNTSATLILPATGAITESGHPAADSEGVEAVTEKDGSTKLKLGSGQYQFAFTQRN